MVLLFINADSCFQIYYESIHTINTPHTKVDFIFYKLKYLLKLTN